MNPTARRRGHSPLTRHEALHFNRHWTDEDRAKINRTLDALGVVELTLAPAGQEFAGWNTNGDKVVAGMGGTLWLGSEHEVPDAVARDDYQVVLLSNATGSVRGRSKPELWEAETCPNCFTRHADQECPW